MVKTFLYKHALTHAKEDKALLTRTLCVDPLNLIHLVHRVKSSTMISNGPYQEHL